LARFDGYRFMTWLYEMKSSSSVRVPDDVTLCSTMFQDDSPAYLKPVIWYVQRRVEGYGFAVVPKNVLLDSEMS